MAESEAFDFVCELLERLSPLDRLAARGTVRLSLKQAGLEPCSVTPAQMLVVVERILPRELEARGVLDLEGLAAALERGLRGLAPGDAGETPDAVFRRLGGET